MGWGLRCAAHGACCLLPRQGNAAGTERFLCCCACCRRRPSRKRRPRSSRSRWGRGREEVGRACIRSACCAGALARGCDPQLVQVGVKSGGSPSAHAPPHTHTAVHQASLEPACRLPTPTCTSTPTWRSLVRLLQALHCTLLLAHALFCCTLLGSDVRLARPTCPSLLLPPPCSAHPRRRHGRRLWRRAQLRRPVPAILSPRLSSVVACICVCL